jgi:acyl carrier protein
MDPDPSDILRSLHLAVMSGELHKEDSLEPVSSKLEEIIGCDSTDIVELFMALEEKGVKPTVAELIKLFEGNDSDDANLTPVRK